MQKRQNKNRNNKFQASFGANKTEQSNGKNEIIKRGRVVEALPNASFTVQYEDGTKGLAMIGGKMKVFKIRVLVGDMVEAVIDPYSKKGRIVKRG